jgi:D-alanine transfer protein
MKDGSTPRRPHLAAALNAMAVVATLLSVGYVWAKNTQDRLLHSAAPEFCDAKLHGVALIREAFTRPDTLVMFGSSELIPDVPMKGVDFFSDLPTGFSVFPVGKAGTTALSVLQKLGGAGEVLTGKKVVLSLSPSFFQSETVDAKYFEGNSSKLQTKELLWSDEFSQGLKSAAAKQILAYPKAYEGDWVLGFTLRRVAAGGWMDRVMLSLIEPYAHLDRAVGRVQDHAEATAALLEVPQGTTKSKKIAKGKRTINWDELFLSAEQSSKALANRSKRKPLKASGRIGEGDSLFVGRMQKAQEWRDFELVLRLIKEAGAYPLVISMPVHADVLEAQGVSKKGWMEYGRELKALTAKYEAPLIYLEDHERDAIFFVDHADHIGSKGWWYYNKAMDDFFHNRPGFLPVASQATLLR